MAAMASTTTRIMFSKGMVSKSKYWISEKNKGIPVHSGLFALLQGGIEQILLKFTTKILTYPF